MTLLHHDNDSFHGRQLWSSHVGTHFTVSGGCSTHCIMLLSSLSSPGSVHHHDVYPFRSLIFFAASSEYSRLTEGTTAIRP